MSRLSGAVEVHPTDLTGKSPLTIEGDSVNGVGYWPIVRQRIFDPNDTRLNDLSPAWLYGDHLDLTFKKVHLGVGGRLRQTLGAVLQCKSGSFRFEECTLTASADDGRTTAVGSTLPLIQMVAGASSALDVQIETSLLRGGRLAELIQCQSSAQVQLRVSGTVWAGGPAHTIRFNGASSEADITIDRSTLYNINGLCQVSRSAETTSSSAPFRVHVDQSLLVGNSMGSAQLFAVTESGAPSMSSEAARATFAWQGTGNVIHRINQFLPAGERTRLSLEDFTSLFEIKPNELVSIDPILRCYPSGIELQECEARDFESRLLSTSRRVKNLPAKIGVSADEVPHVLTCVMERAVTEPQTVTTPKGIPRVLVVNQNTGPYRTLEEAFAELSDDDIIEISDDATYTPARNFDLVSVRGVLNVDKPMFVHLRAARDKKPTIVLSDVAQRGTYPKFHQDEVPHNYCLFLMSLNSQSVRLDGIRFQTNMIGNTHHSFIHTTASSLRITNCEFIDLSQAPHAMVTFYWNNGVAYIEPTDWQSSLRTSQPHGTLTWIENCVVVNPVARMPLPIDIRTSEIAFNVTGWVSPRHITMRNVAIGENLIGLYDEATSQREFVRIENCTILGRPIAFVQERGGVEYRFENNLVVCPDNPIPAEPGGLIARLPSFGDNNVVWLLNGLVTPEQRNTGSLRLLPGPVLKSPPQSTGRLSNDDVLKPFRLKVTVARQSGGHLADSFGIRPEYFKAR